jgi:hypothetical protein
MIKNVNSQGCDFSCMLDQLNLRYCSTDHFHTQSATSRLLTAGSVLLEILNLSSNSKVIRYMCCNQNPIAGRDGWVSYDDVNLESFC